MIIALPAATPAAQRNSAKFALGTFQNQYDWPDGYAFFLSFLAPLWTICTSPPPLSRGEMCALVARCVRVVLIMGWVCG